MAGDAADTSVIFWTRTRAPRRSCSACWRWTATASRRCASTAGSRPRARASCARSSRAAPQPLHLYAFLVGPRAPQRAQPDRARATAIAADSLAPIVFAGTSCTNQNAGPSRCSRHAGSRTDLDFFIHAGDHIYTDHGALASHPRGVPREVRAKLVLRGDALAAPLDRACTSPGTTTRCFNNWNPETIAPRAPRRARQAFFEHRATRRNASATDRLWRSFRWGRTAEVFILDCRSERRPSTRSTTPVARTRRTSPARRWTGSSRACAPRPACSSSSSTRCPSSTAPGGQRQLERLRLAAPGDPQPHRQQQPPGRGVALGRRALRRRVPRRGAGPWSDIWEVIMGPGGRRPRRAPRRPRRAVARAGVRRPQLHRVRADPNDPHPHRRVHQRRRQPHPRQPLEHLLTALSPPYTDG
jgi:hypothetical protein